LKNPVPNSKKHYASPVHRSHGFAPCPHLTAHHLIADEEVLKIGSVAANILNKQSETTDKRWTSSFEIGRELNTHPRKPGCYEIRLRIWRARV